MKQHNHTSRTKRSPEYHTWNGMIQRCTNPSSAVYKYYGGRGITVDDAWRDFRQFYADMGPRPAGYTLERIDNSRGYSKENCEWRTPKDQARNTSANHLLEARGERHCISEWADRVGLTHDIIRTRLRLGWSVESAIFTPRIYTKKQSDTLEESIKVAQQRNGVAA